MEVDEADFMTAEEDDDVLADDCLIFPSRAAPPIAVDYVHPVNQLKEFKLVPEDSDGSIEKVDEEEDLKLALEVTRSLGRTPEFFPDVEGNRPRYCTLCDVLQTNLSPVACDTCLVRWPDDQEEEMPDPAADAPTPEDTPDAALDRE